MTEPQITPTWQSVFINLINQSANYYIEGLWFKCYDTLLILQSWLPKECYDETKANYDEVKKSFENLAHHKYSVVLDIHRQIHITSNRFWRQTIPVLSGEVKRSLEKHGYLTRESGAKPKFDHKGNVPKI